MKPGANYIEINKMKRLQRMGYTAEQISQHMMIDLACVKSHLASDKEVPGRLPPEEPVVDESQPAIPRDEDEQLPAEIASEIAAAEAQLED